MQKTLKYGGRKELPTATEVDALCSGRMNKRQIILLPGSVPFTLNLKPSSVVQEVVAEIVRQMDRVDPLEEEEYALCSDNGHEDKPLRKEDYVFDHLVGDSAQHNVTLFFKRVIWFFPLQRQVSPMFALANNRAQLTQRISNGH